MGQNSENGDAPAKSGTDTRAHSLPEEDGAQPPEEDGAQPREVAAAGFEPAATDDNINTPPVAVPTTAPADLSPINARFPGVAMQNASGSFFARSEHIKGLDQIALDQIAVGRNADNASPGRPLSEPAMQNSGNVAPSNDSSATLPSTTDRAWPKISLPSLNQAGLKLQQLRRDSKQVDEHLHKISRKHSFRIFREIFAGVFVILFLCVGSLYAFLSRGPIEVNFLTGTIEKAVNAELSGLTTHIESIIFRRDPDNLGIQFRLRNVTLSNLQGKVVAKAPLAAIGISAKAFMQGRVAPSSVSLIGPQLRMSYGDDGGLALSFDHKNTRTNRSGRAPQKGNPGEMDDQLRGGLKGEEPNPDGAPGDVSGGVSGDVSRQSEATALQAPQLASHITVGKALAHMFKAGRRGEHVSSNLTTFGIKDAIVVFDHNGRRESLWHIVTMDFDLGHSKNRSVLSGAATIRSAGGARRRLAPPWTVKLYARLPKKSDSIELRLRVKNLWPNSLANSFPIFKLFHNVDLPVGLFVNGELSDEGKLKKANVNVRFTAGTIDLKLNTDSKITINRGKIALRYDGSTGKVELVPSVLRWGQGSSATLAGTFSPHREASGLTTWHYNIHSSKAIFKGRSQKGKLPALKVDRWTSTGQFNPDTGVLNVSDYTFQAENASFNMAGLVKADLSGVSTELKGRLSAMPLSTFRRIWPDILSSQSRTWVDKHLKSGQLTGGRVTLNLAPGDLDMENLKPSLSANALNVILGFSDVSLFNGPDVPIIQIPRVLVQMKGSRFEVDIPRATAPVLPKRQKTAHLKKELVKKELVKKELVKKEPVRPAAKKPAFMSLSHGKYVIADWRPELMHGELDFKFSGDLPTTKRILDRAGAHQTSARRPSPLKLTGKVSGHVNIKAPVRDEIDLTEMTITGRARVKKIRGRKVAGKYGITAGTIDVSFTNKALQANGEILIAGVPATLALQHIYGAAPEKQPPVRLTTNLNGKARQRLGITIDHIVQGNIPTHLTLVKRPDGVTNVQFEADLTSAEITLADIAWRKPRGQRAVVSFLADETRSGRIALKNINVTGEDIDVTGSITLSAKQKLEKFHFDNFSFSFLTRIELSGRLRAADNVLEIKAKGKTYDGKAFFKSLFSAGQRSSTPRKRAKNAPGLDLEVDVDSLIGFSDTTLKDVQIIMSRRHGKLTTFKASGKLNGHAPLSVHLDNNAKRKTPKSRPKTFSRSKRLLQAETSDAGSAFRLIGFYPRVVGGEASLQVDLDGRGIAEKTGILWVRNFNVLGDEVISEVVASSALDPDGADTYGKKRTVRQRYFFDRLKAPFSVGHNQLILKNAYINGPLIGATLRGKVDFGRQKIALGGTYIPAYGLNSALGVVPILGKILVGRSGEGIFGITFGITGHLKKPTVLINPVSAITPGIFRQMFDFTTTKPRIVPQKPRRSSSQKSPPAAAPENSSTSSVFEEN